jgi:hypothetical protein
MMKRCIAYRTSTGERCSKRVGIRSQDVCLCREHAHSLWLVIWAESLPREERESLSEGSWDNYRGLPS